MQRFTFDASPTRGLTAPASLVIPDITITTTILTTPSTANTSFSSPLLEGPASTHECQKHSDGKADRERETPIFLLFSPGDDESRNNDRNAAMVNNGRRTGFTYKNDIRTDPTLIDDGRRADRGKSLSDVTYEGVMLPSMSVGDLSEGEILASRLCGTVNKRTETGGSENEEALAGLPDSYERN